MESNNTLYIADNGEPAVPVIPLQYPDMFIVGSALVLQFQRDMMGEVHSVSANIEPGIDPVVFVKPNYTGIHWYGMPNGVRISNSCVS